MAALPPSDVAPDGSPVLVYRRLPPRGEPELIHGAVDPGASVLELGCGPGRVTGPLVDLGHPVVAVDDSPEMLSHVRGAEVVLGDVYALDLGRRFDAVVAASHLVNEPERRRRRSLFAVAARHVRPGGVVLVERYEPGWPGSVGSRTGAASGSVETSVGDVTVRLHDVAVDIDGEVVSAAVTYGVDGRSWTQRFTARVLGDERFVAEAAEVGLTLDRWLDDRRTWARLVAA